MPAQKILIRKIDKKRETTMTLIIAISFGRPRWSSVVQPL